MPIGNEFFLLLGLIFAAAVLYTSVGHAGASGYIAAMALLGVAPAIMKPTALALNILVASLAVYRLWRAGLVEWRLLPPLLITAVPAAFLGGMLQLPGNIYKPLVGVILLVAAYGFLFQPTKKTLPEEAHKKPVSKVPLLAGLVAGGAIGLLSGVTGTGGGIFLSPLLLLLGWADARRAMGIAAPFILVNSLAGMAGNIAVVNRLPPELPYLMGAALVGALIGTQLSIRWFSLDMLKRVLGVVLVVAGLKFILG
jgi:uncharacterized protein